MQIKSTKSQTHNPVVLDVHIRDQYCYKRYGISHPTVYTYFRLNKL